MRTNKVSNKTQADREIWQHLTFEIDGKNLININGYHFLSKCANIIVMLEFENQDLNIGYGLTNRDGSSFELEVYMPEIVVKYKGNIVKSMEEINSMEGIEIYNLTTTHESETQLKLSTFRDGDREQVINRINKKYGK